MRRLILFTLSLIAFFGAIVAALSISNERDYQLRGYVDATQSHDVPYRVPRLGVNAELTQYDTESLHAQLDVMQRAHITWVRQTFDWNAYEPQRGQISADVQRQWDAIADAFRTRDDLELVAVLMYSPVWARDTQAADNPTAPPQNPDDFAAFVRAFAQRYGDVVDVYQIWDEPNLFTVWGGLDPRPADYLALLQAAHTAIHSADPDALVMAAALAPTTETRGQNISDIDYLRDLYALGAAPYMDAVAAKPYGFDRSPLDRTISPDTLNFSRLIALREVMVAAGDSKKALWASNWGWNSLPTEWTGAPSIWGQVDSATRTHYTLEAFNRAEREWAWLGGLILHHWQPQAPPDDPQWGFALVDADNQPTLLLDALMNREPMDAATNGLYHPRNPFTAYSGVWTFSDLGADIGWQRDSRFALSFHGRDVAVLVRKDDYVGYLYPQVDGQPANALPRDAAGNSYLILTSGSLEPELALVPVARGLTNTTHTFTATADRGFDRWALAGFAVSSGDLRAPYERQITLAWVTTLAAFIALITSGIGIQWRTVFAPLNGLMHRLHAFWQWTLSIMASIVLMIGMLLTFGDSVPHVFRRESVNFIAALITSGLIYLNPAFIVTVIAALILFVLIFNRPVIGLALIVGYAPLFLFPVELYRFAFPMAELLLFITFAAWLLWQAVARAQHRKHTDTTQPAWHWHALDFVTLAFVTLGLLALLWSPRRDVAMTEYRTLFFEPALFYLMLRTFRLTARDWRHLFMALMGAGLLVALVGIILYVQGEAVITAEGEARRMASVYGSPNNVALLLGRVIPFLLAALLLIKPLRWLSLAALLPILAAFALTQSVGGLFLALPMSIVAVLLMVYRRRALVWLIGLALIGGIGFMVLASQSDRFARALDFSQGTNFFRLRLWESTFDILADAPVTGLGLDQFLYAFRGIYIRPDAWQEPNLSHPHNIVLDFWTRLGIGGVVLLMGGGIVLWRAMQRASITDVHERMLFVGVVGALTYTITHGLIDNSLFVNDLIVIHMLLMAFIAFISLKSAARK